MEHIAIEARPRDGRATKGELKRQRRMGHIPAAIFGRGTEPALVTVEARELARVLNSDAGKNTLIDLSFGGRRHLVKLAEVDMDPITRVFLHVGLHTIAANEQTKATVPVEIVGEPEEVRTGVALLEVGTQSVEVTSLPEDLVASLTLDVSNMHIGDVLHVSDLKVPERIEVLTAQDAPLVSLHVMPSMVEEVQETIDAESAEASEGEESA